jgi:putative ABC transport system permease protein
MNNAGVLKAMRGLVKHKKYVLLNIAGLAIGLASFILIVLWVQDELSYDSFHQDAENIGMVLREESYKPAAATSKLLAPTIKNELPEVLESTCFLPLPKTFQLNLKYKENSYEEHLALADSNFFNIFSFQLAEGTGSDAFKSPNSIVITEKIRQKYFGSEKALGKALTITFLGQKKLLNVTGVIQDIPHNSHISSEVFIPIDFMNIYGVHWDEWYNRNPRTYIKIAKGTNLAELGQKILQCKQKYFEEDDLGYSILPLKKIHLHSTGIQFFNSGGDIRYVYIFSAIAFVILLIAGMNYVNLSNVLSLKRSKEIGIKKTFGIRRSQIIMQCYAETFAMTFVSALVAIILSYQVLPLVNNISGKELVIPFGSLKFAISLLLIIVVTSLLSGFYPALFMSGFKPVRALKGKLVKGNSSKFRKGIVTFQFALSIVIIICTLAISNQLRFIRNKDIGYDKENLLYILPSGSISDHYKAFKNTVIESGFVSSATRSNSLDVSNLGRTEGVNWTGKQKKFSSWVIYTDQDFATTYKISIKEGRFYSDEYKTDSKSGFVINERAAKEMGFDEPLGKVIDMWGRKGKIIGVVKDFHFNSFHHAIEPLIFLMPGPEEINMVCNAVTFRLKPNSLPGTIKYLEKTWNTFFPDENFNYAFVDEQLNTRYFSEYRMGKLFNYFSILAIFIACLGLFGLTSFTIEQKNKEIGVHKVIGAKEAHVMYLLSKDYIIWITIAFIIASPVAYYFLNLWFGNFAYRTTISWWIFALAGFAVTGIAILTVSLQSWRTARKNPVEALRYE